MSFTQKNPYETRPDTLECGELARLIPTTADSNKEARAASIFLATLMTVLPYSKEILAAIGQNVGQRTKITCFTEIKFKKEKDTNLRPDGIITTKTTKSNQWSGIVEAKIDNAELKTSQVEDYLRLARRNDINYVLTISNQPVAHPTHSPVKVSGTLQRSVKLYHFSWVYLLTTAQLVLDEGDFETVEQKYILKEFIRFMSHPSSGVKRFEKMNPEWREICNKAISKVALNKTNDLVDNTVGAWHQEARDICLLMSEKLNRSVRLHLSRTHVADPDKRLKHDCDNLVKNLELKFTLDIPDAAAPLIVTANLRSRVISVSMSLTAPKDKQRATSRVNWLVKQLTKSNSDDIYIVSNLPGRIPPIHKKLEHVRQDSSVLVGENKTLPVSFDVFLARDIAGKFSGSKKFIEELESAVPHFYSEVGQHLKAYTPPAPPIKKSPTKSNDTKPNEDTSHIVPVENEPQPADTQARPTNRPDGFLIQG